MNVTVKGKQLDVGDALRSYVGDNLNQAVKKYFPHTIDGQVVFARDAHLFTADIQLHVGRGLVLQSHGQAADAYPAFDDCLQKLGRQLQRYKTRIQNHRQDAVDESALVASTYVIEHKDTAEEVANDQPLVIAEMQTSIQSLTVSEAVMHMDLADLPALLFKNSAHGGLNMVYRRKDGNVGWVDPIGNSSTVKA